MLVGIYKITSPTGRIYIGQSWNIVKRMKTHKACKSNRLLANSITKYGKENHHYRVVQTLPPDVSQEVLDNYECFFIDQFTEAGFKMMNLKGGGSNGKMSESSKALLKKNFTQERKEDLRKKYTGENNPMYGKKGELCPNFGIKRPKEFGEAVKARNSGEKNGFFGKTHTVEYKEETRKRMSERTVSKSTRDKIAKARKECWKDKDYVQNMVNKHAKFNYKILCPDKTIVETNSVKQFCREKKLRSTSLQETFSVPNFVFWGYKIIERTPIIKQKHQNSIIS